MQRIRVGVIGLGIGEQHVRGYLRNSSCSLVAICDLDEKKLERILELAPTVRTTTNSQEIIEASDIDLVSIASYDEDHFEQIDKALDYNKHVFVEKPLCQTHRQLSTIKQKWLAQHGRTKIMSNLVLRSAPAYQAIRQQILSGRLGSVYAFDGDYLYGRLSKITDGWRANTEGYSIIAGGAVHLVDLMLWMTGERPASVTTLGNRICTKGSLFRYDDFAAMTLAFPSGMIGRITANFGCVHGHQHVVRVFGTTGTFLNDDLGPRLQTHRDPAPAAERLTLATLPESKYVLIEEFVSGIRDGRDLSEDTALDFDVMSICISADESLRTGKTTEIRYV